MLIYQNVETLVRQDFEAFDFSNSPIERCCQWHKKRHIHMATQLTLNAFSNKSCYMKSDVEDFVHGLNHLFFLGVGCGQTMERTGTDEG